MNKAVEASMEANKVEGRAREPGRFRDCQKYAEAVFLGKSQKSCDSPCETFGNMMRYKGPLAAGADRESSYGCGRWRCGGT